MSAVVQVVPFAAAPARVRGARARASSGSPGTVKSWARPSVVSSVSSGARVGAGPLNLRGAARIPARSGLAVNDVASDPTGSFATVSPEFVCSRLNASFALEPFSSPFAEGSELYGFGFGQKFVDDDDCVLLNALRYEALECQVDDPDCSSVDQGAGGGGDLPMGWSGKWAMRAGPREKIFFNPPKVKAAIVTCGGLCPGLNDVIRQLVITLEEYGVQDIKGIRYGFKGFVEQEGELRAPIVLNEEVVETIHLDGGSILGSSRGGSDTGDIVDAVAEMGLDFLFVIGGNGSHAGAMAIDDLCKERGVCTSVIGIPKTIDNDLLLLDRTFGFQTAVDEAIKAGPQPGAPPGSACCCIAAASAKLSG